jgi:chorismate lyase/3-hydroxybenzoate synthase
LALPHREVLVEAKRMRWLQPLRPQPPAWVSELAATSSWTHLTTSIPEAALTPPASLERAVAGAYLRLAAQLTDAGRFAVRFWNFIPGIHTDMGDGRDRYMVFNAGRFAAFESWLGPAVGFGRALPTASAVGVASGPVAVHCLAATSPGTPLENPRQIPAYTYSRRYGPLPPCFARATLMTPPTVAPGVSMPVTHALRGDAELLVGGTASIVGEDSAHEGDAEQQAVETLEHLSTLVRQARNSLGRRTQVERAPLDAFTELRVYIVRNEDADMVRDLIGRACPRARRIEFAQADLCRRELLVEIEGLALL